MAFPGLVAASLMAANWFVALVPGLGHCGGDFEDHARQFLSTQLSDWSA